MKIIEKKSMRKYIIFASIITMLIFVASNIAHAVPFKKGDIFISTNYSYSYSGAQVLHYSADGTYIETLQLGLTVWDAPKGMAFDSAGNLYVTLQNANAVVVLDNSGNPKGTFASGQFMPYSIAIDKQGNFFVGGYNDIRLYDPAGNYIRTILDSPALLIDISQDNKTLYFTYYEQVPSSYYIHTIDIATGMLGPDFNKEPAVLGAGDLRILPDGCVLMINGGTKVSRYNSAGEIVQTYSYPNANYNFLRNLNLDSDGTSFWVFDEVLGDLYKFDISSGNVLQIIATNMLNGTINGSILGIVVYGGTANAPISAPISAGTYVRVIDTVYSANNDIDINSFSKIPYSVNKEADKTSIEWRYNNFSIDQIENLAFDVVLKNPVPGEDRLIDHKLEVLYETAGNIISTIAGNGSQGPSGDGGSATQAGFFPEGITIDTQGNIYIADDENHRVRKVDANGIITTVAGIGQGGFSGDGGPATQAMLRNPSGVAIDNTGNLYITDTNNHRIRKIDVNGIITTVAGNGNPSFSGDGGSALLASLNKPTGITVNSAGVLYFSDTYNYRIRKINVNGFITTVAGNGQNAFSGDGGQATQASLFWPLGIGVDDSENIYFAEQSSHRVRMVEKSGIITTIAGNGPTSAEGKVNPDFRGDGGLAIEAGLFLPYGVVLDKSGNLYIADRGNHRIRKVDVNGIITTVAGNGDVVFSGDNGPALQASMEPLGIAIDPAGILYISDDHNYRVRKLSQLIRTELGPQSVQVLSSALTGTITTDKPAYQSNEDVVLSSTIKNLSGYTTTIDAKILLEDNKGNLVRVIATLPSLAFLAGETRSLGSLVFNTGSYYAGDYRVHLILTENQKQAGEVISNFKIQSNIAISSKVSMDKMSYNPNETATITSSIVSASTNSVFGNLTAKLTIAGTGGSTVFTETKPITTLIPGALFTFKSYWNTGTYVADTYPVTLEVRDAANTLIATGTQNLVISNIVRPSYQLRGQISVDRQSIMTGETVTASYSVTNIGNMNLSDVAISILTINTKDLAVYNTLVSQATLSMGSSYQANNAITALNYSAKDYLVVLRASINGTEETLAGTYLRVEGAPTAPSLLSPANGANTDTFTPTLIVNNASDPNDDKLTYEFELYADSGLTQLVASSGLISETTSTTTWQVPATLTENSTYYWRSRAYDTKLYGPWMEAASFRVNTVNDPPSAPILSSPMDNGIVSSLTPTLTVINATDPDSPSLIYNFELALDPNFSQIIAATTGIPSDTGTTSWQAPGPLAENMTYYWRAQADDWLMEGPWSTTGSFFVNTANDAPSIPIIIVPVNGASLKALEADITVQNSTDPDSPSLTYTFELDTIMTFDSATIMRSGAIQQGQGATAWHVTGLTEDTQYYVRAKASDGQADSAWSAITGFFTNALNDAPTTPMLANPSNGAGVNVFSPTLSIHNSTDPDRDVLTYEFQVYADAALTSLVTSTTTIAETSQTTSWTVPVSLTENQTYYWRARANDGNLNSPWMATAAFFVNTANDAPGSPVPQSPTDGSTVTTLMPVLAVTNAIDPDSDKLTYEFEIYQNNVLISSITNVPESSTGTTSATLTTSLTNNTLYQWRARAFDGDRYGPWTAMASFTVHLTQTGITVDIDFEPETLNKKSHGKWVLVKIELPHGYKAKDVDISSIRLEGIVHAELWPYEYHYHHFEHGCDHDRRGHEHETLMVKFKRSDVIDVLPEGKHVPVHVTGMVGSTPFDGVDVIRVCSSEHDCGGH